MHRLSTLRSFFLQLCVLREIISQKLAHCGLVVGPKLRQNALAANLTFVIGGETDFIFILIPPGHIFDEGGEVHEPGLGRDQLWLS